MSNVMYYRLQGRTPVPECDVLAWSIWFSTAERQRLVALTRITADIHVSTLFLGLNPQESADEDALPLLFETMVFGGALTPCQRRYSTWEEAERGHAEVVHACQQALDLPVDSAGETLKD